MSELALVLSIIATFSGVTGTFYGVRGFRYARGASVRANQEKLRGELKEILSRQGRIIKAVNQLHTRMPSSLFPEELAKLRSDLIRVKDHLLAPTPAQLQKLIGSVEGAQRTYKEITSLPTDDSIFLADVEKKQRMRLKQDLEEITKQINVLLNGLVRIDQKTLTPRKQRKLFKKLEG